MTNRKLQISGSIALATLLGCSTGGVLVIDSALPEQAVAQDVDDGYFYANLAPDGQWFFQADLGWVWHPSRVSAGWRPYTDGQWVWADDAGWTWASNEPWGWATYHYGRWYFDPTYGWSWVPGRTWAPAWVSWRVEDGYIGWAPLWPVYFDVHPEFRWDSWHHDHDWDRRHQGRDWDRWVFTRDRDFTLDRVGRHAITDHRERDSIYSRSRDVTQFDENHPERIGHSIDRGMIERAVGRPVRSVHIETVDKPGKRDDTRGDRLQVFRPHVQETPDKTPDRLGLAKEPSREAREHDTIRQEKSRLDAVKDNGKGQNKGGRDAGNRNAEPDNRRDPSAGGPADSGHPTGTQHDGQPQGRMHPSPQERPQADRQPNERAQPAQHERPQVEQQQQQRSEPQQHERPQVDRQPQQHMQPAQSERPQADRQPQQRMQPAQNERPQAQHQPQQRMQPEQRERPQADRQPQQRMQPAQHEHPQARPQDSRPEQAAPQQRQDAPAAQQHGQQQRHETNGNHGKPPGGDTDPGQPGQGAH